jgi:hypothetical protein
MGLNMLDFSNFIVRISGRGPDIFYIDCGGIYHVGDIAAGAGVSSEKIAAIYVSNGGQLNKELDVYYFSSIDSAKKAISEIYVVIHNSSKGKSVFFTENEIQYLRKALIYNASSFAGANSRTADLILKKLNG